MYVNIIWTDNTKQFNKKVDKYIVTVIVISSTNINKTNTSKLPSPLDNWISKGKTCINKQFKTCTDSLPLKKDHINTKMDDKIKMYFLYNLIKYFKNENKRQSWWIIQNVKV
jgi:hypothetical protein